MKAKEFIPTSKPRNFVAKNQKTAGAGAHKDKKKAEKQGDVKHKGKQFAEGVAEGNPWANVIHSTDIHAEKAQRELKNKQAVADSAKVLKNHAKALEPKEIELIKKYNLFHRGRMPEGSYGRLDDEKAEKLIQNVLRFNEQGVAEYGDTAKGQKMLTKVQKRAVDRMIKADDKRDAKDAKKNQDTANRAWERMSDKDESIEMERVRDPEDWDEGNTEPPNNFAVYINGKKWKVFKGRGQFADDYKERDHYRQLQSWAQQKSAQTGKKWEIAVTGESPTA